MTGDTETPDTAQAKFAIGQAVQHPAFGAGVVAAYRDNGGLRVRFGLNSKMVFPDQVRPA